MGMLNLGALLPSLISRHPPLILCEHPHPGFFTVDLVPSIDGLVFSGYFLKCCFLSYIFLFWFVCVLGWWEAPPKMLTPLKNCELLYYKGRKLHVELTLQTTWPQHQVGSAALKSVREKDLVVQACSLSYSEGWHNRIVNSGTVWACSGPGFNLWYHTYAKYYGRRRPWVSQSYSV